MMLNNEQLKSFVVLSQLLEDSEINVNDCQFKVLSEEEINEEFYNFQQNLFDDLGLNSFSHFAYEHIMSNFVDTRYFDDLHYDIIRENQEYYDEEQVDELCRIYEENDINKVLDIDLQEQLNSVDSVEWCRDWAGDDETERIILENDLLDFDSLVEWIKDTDGYDILGQYDGNVWEYVENGETYYIYRVY